MFMVSTWVNSLDGAPVVRPEAGYQPFLEPLPDQDTPPGVTVLFSPGDDIEMAVIREINQPTVKEILFSQYAVTNERIIKSLIDAHDRGVIVIGILEPKPAIGNYVVPRRLADSGIPLLFTAGGGWNNNKFAIIDRAKLLTGSFDWTRSAPGNFENLLIISEVSIVTRYYNAWVKTARSSKTYAAALQQSAPLKQQQPGPTATRR